MATQKKVRASKTKRGPKTLNGQIREALFNAANYITFHTIRERVDPKATPRMIYVRLHLFLKKGLIERKFENGYWRYRLSTHGYELTKAAYHGGIRTVFRRVRRQEAVA